MSKTWKALLAVALLSPVMATAYTLGDVKSPPGTVVAGDKPRPRLKIVVNEPELQKRRPARIVYVNGAPTGDGRGGQEGECVQSTGSRLIWRDKADQRCANRMPGQVFVVTH